MADLYMETPSNKFDFKRHNRWVIDILTTNGKEIKPWIIQTSSRPTFTRSKFWEIWKGFNVDEIHIDMVDPISPSTSKVLYDYMIKDYKIDYDLKLLDPTGVVVEKWEVKRCKILEVDFGVLNYEKDSLATCSLLLKPTSAKLVF